MNSVEESLAGIDTRIPVSAYRIQYNEGFTFRDAELIVPYLAELGITDVYSSPCFASREGSLHGYDIVDYNSINDELGGEEGFKSFVNKLRTHSMGQILDIVPNHMCIASDLNRWWRDVLENGPGSVYADVFDIVWEPVKAELKNKVLLPTLGDQYGKVLEKGELLLSYIDGSFAVRYYDRSFPVRPRTYTIILRTNLDTLREHISEDSQVMSEYLSIITALNHLPSPLVKESRKVQERYREKEVIQARLHRLYANEPAIRNHIDAVVAGFNGRQGDPRSFDDLDRLLSEQVYRLAFWRVAAEEINYRRFFDINDLAAVRMEDPAVFRKTHELLFKLIGEGSVTGLRVDHADGLADPAGYLRWLQRDAFLSVMRSHSNGVIRGLPEDLIRKIYDPLGEDGVTPGGDRELRQRYRQMETEVEILKPFYIVAEKILTKGERMPEDWPAYSTTGYVFLNSVNGIFIDMNAEKAFDDIYTRITRQNIRFQDIAHEKKKLIMQVAMSSEITMLAHYLQQFAERDRHTRDFTLNSLLNSLVDVIAYFPVYRTYTSSAVVLDRDRKYIEIAVAKAKKKNPAISGSIFDYLRDVLLLKFPQTFGEKEKADWLNFVMRFQQLTGPIMAKGIEDTAFYTYNRFTSLNEVGGAPDRFGTPIETFHGQNIERLKFWPHALITTATHDTKRGEDLRARLNVLSEMPERWRDHVHSWHRINYKKKAVIDGRRVPDKNEEYLLYQTLVGAWPFHERLDDPRGTFTERISRYMLKAVREAKVNSSWINPDSSYEEGLDLFIRSVLSRPARNAFLADFVPFAGEVAEFGIYNSFSQTLLKITSPGVPDFYQGTELWDLNLVDPDNRWPVDFKERSHCMEQLKQGESSLGPAGLAKKVLEERKDGRIKMYVIWKALALRRSMRRLFEQGEYVPLETMGAGFENICAFERGMGGRRIVVAVPRLLARLLRGKDSLPLGPDAWGDTAVIVPFASGGMRFRNVFTDEIITAVPHEGATVLPASALFRTFPVALAECIGTATDGE
ncbi:MAG: malto-oligosyltrehalose synthase [Nitrospiraceae bacterium]|nr:malto-oligosyltrehalose synthase [Nitrospiraceae bacterium]